MNNGNIGNYTEKDYFVADKDIVDSIKTEYSASPPQEQELINKLSQLIAERILNEFEKYIPPKKREDFKTIGDRILILDDEGFDEFDGDWTPNSRRSDSGSAAGSYKLVGNFIVMRDMKKQAQEYYENNKELLAEFPEIKSSDFIQYVRFSAIGNVLTHELVHACQEYHEPKTYRENFTQNALIECGASFITSGIVKELFPPGNIIDTNHGDERISKFKKILQKYGEDAYNVFFNNIPNDPIQRDNYENLKKQILSEFDSQTLVELGILRESLAGLYTLVSDSEIR